MSFLHCPPCVFVIEKEYEILINTTSCGIIYIEVAGTKFYEENTGVLSSEKSFVKIRIPQEVLNKAGAYTVVFRQTICRKAYFSTFMPEQREDFVFQPLTKTENIHLYHIADVHNFYDAALHTASYFGDEIDLFVINGDIAEVNAPEDYVNTAAFVGKISQGKIPVVFARGNHDTRGHWAEFYADYFPTNHKNTYFTFEIGCISGIVLDCGEDKLDDYHDKRFENPDVYGGVNIFELYRRRETQWLKSVPPLGGKIRLAVSHLCPMQVTTARGSVVDIERDLYTQWEQELERLQIDFMLSGHIHRAYILNPNDPDSLIPHNFPVVVGSAIKYVYGSDHVDNLEGTAVTLNPDRAEILFTNQNHAVSAKNTLYFKR